MSILDGYQGDFGQAEAEHEGGAGISVISVG